jgi:hypothetical protein
MGINDKLSDAMYGAGPNQDAALARILMPIKQAHQASLDAAGGVAGDKYTAAKQLWAKLMDPWNNPSAGSKFLQNWMQKPDPNDAMKALTLMGDDKAKIFLAKAGPTGRQALQSGYAETVLNYAKDPVTGTLNPTRALTAMNARQALFGNVFDQAPELAAKWGGFRNLMLYAHRVNYVIPGKFGIGPSELAAKLFTTQTGADLLLGMSKMNPDSAAMKSFSENVFPKIFGGIVLPKAVGSVLSPAPQTNLDNIIAPG